VAVREADEDLVAAVDVDVLDIGVLQERLEPADPEQRRVDGGGGRLLLLGGLWAPKSAAWMPSESSASSSSVGGVRPPAISVRA